MSIKGTGYDLEEISYEFQKKIMLLEKKKKNLEIVLDSMVQIYLGGGPMDLIIKKAIKVLKKEKFLDSSKIMKKYNG